MLNRRELLQTAAAAAAMSASGQAPARAQTHYDFLETTASAEAGFIFGLPVVMSYAVMYEQAVDHRSGHFNAPFNRIRNVSGLPASKSTHAALPNNDVAYSLLWVDLRTEPIVLSVPAVDARRYYSIMLRDGKFYNYGYIGSRATGSEAGDYMVVGPDWHGQAPPGIKRVFRSSTEFSLALFRTQIFNPHDIRNVRKVQAGYGLEPLSKYMQQVPPRRAKTIDFQQISGSHLRRNFFQHLAFALQFAPAQFIEARAVARLARLGVGPGKTFNFSDLSPKDEVEISLGIRLGDDKIDRAMADAKVIVNGWQIAPYFGDSALYDGNWLLRAAAAKADFYGDDPQEAVFAVAQVDDEESSLDGGRHGYTLTFARDRLPPVDAFWSLTMYGAGSRSLIANPIQRYFVNSSMLPTMKTDSDGGLTIYIQHKSPGAGKSANWLPAPNRRMLLGMRLYWPKTESPSILPIGKGTWQPPAVKRVR
ncbi:MAG: DUF1254 domain-containing protein [Bradyrhizobium sp.]